MIHGVVARRGIQAIQLTHANRYNIADLVHGQLRQHMRIENRSDVSYTYKLSFERGGSRWEMTEGEWLLISPQGFVAIMDPESFDAWFETVSLSDAAGGSLTR